MTTNRQAFVFPSTFHLKPPVAVRILILSTNVHDSKSKCSHYISFICTKNKEIKQNQSTNIFADATLHATDYSYTNGNVILRYWNCFLAYLSLSILLSVQIISLCSVRYIPCIVSHRHRPSPFCSAVGSG